MPLRNGPHGYGLVTKLLHWLTFAALAAQFVVGYVMVSEDRGSEESACDPPAEDRSGDDLSDAAKARIDRLEEQCERQQDARDARVEDDPLGTAYSDLGSGEILNGGLTLPEVHVLLGLLVLALAASRVVWRRTAGLPPWAEGLSESERTLAHWTEKALLALLFMMPLSGLLLVLVSYDLLPLHIAAHIGFFVAIAAHLGLVLKHQLVDRDRLVSRML
jgi:cytochrome b561